MSVVEKPAGVSTISTERLLVGKKRVSLLVIPRGEKGRKEEKRQAGLNGGPEHKGE